MAKRHDHTRDEIRELAIDAAEQCIQSGGIQTINARKIAKEMGYAVGTLYQLFKSMDLLILAANIRTLKALEAQVLTTINPSSQAPANIAQVAMAYVGFALQYTKRWQAVFEHRMPDDMEVPAGYQQQRARLFALLEQQFSHAYPDMSAQQAALEARALWAGVHGICILALSDKLDDGGMPLQSIVQVLVDHFIRAKGCDKQGEAA